jgi:hypothetical protein
MTVDLLVCERWKLPLPSDADAAYGGRVLKGLHRRSSGVTAGFHALTDLLPFAADRPFESVAEYFGGLGCQTVAIRAMFQPKRHYVLEQEESAAAHLRAFFGSVGVCVARTNSYEHPVIPADLVALDYGDLTAHRLRPGQPQRGLLDRVIAENPRAVLLTDVAAPRLGLHRARYANDLGGPADNYPTYLRSLNGWLRRTYGWRMLTCRYGPWSAKCSLVPDDGGETDFAPTPASPVGLEVLRCCE